MKKRKIKKIFQTKVFNALDLEMFVRTNKRYLYCITQHNKNLEYTKNISEYFAGFGLSFLDFYCQEFNPELITQYFQNWIKNTNNHYTMEKPHGTLHFDIENQKVEIYQIICSNNMITKIFPYIPKTLNDFILMMEYSDVELKWRKKEKL
jgi:hypothetical protein